MLSAVVTVVLATVTSLLLLLKRFRNGSSGDMPGPPAWPILGNALEFATPPEKLMSVLTNIIREYGDVARLWMGPQLNVVVSEPDALKGLLSNPRMSQKGPSYRFMEEYLGGGILSGSGPTWRRHRKLASPNYGKKAIESYTAKFGAETSELVLRLSSVVHKDIDIYREIVKTTSYSVCQTLMALSREETMGLPHLHTLINLTDDLYTAVFNRMTKWYYQLPVVYWFTDSYRFRKRFHGLLKQFCEAIIEHRKMSLKSIVRKDEISLNSDEDCIKNGEFGVIDRFILSKELNENEMITETYTIFTSSQEASAKISSFMLLMIAYHPHYQERLYNEIQSIIGDGGYAIPGAVLKRMTFLDMVFKECVRLFPIGAVIQRTVPYDYTVGQYKIPAGSALLAPIYQLSRDPRYWEKPDQFYPEHFTAENIAKRPANSYMPFSVGPMDCLGRYFGAKLIKTIVVGVLRNYRVGTDEKYEDLVLKVVVSVTSKNGFRMRLTKRK